MNRVVSILTPLLGCCAIAATLAVAPASASSAPRAGRPQAHAAGVCRLHGKEESLGPTYVTYVSVGGGASCNSAFKLIHSYYECRVKHGGVKGTCSGVEGFRCSEHRFLVIKVQFNARVQCTRGQEVIRHEYTQFT